MQAIEFKGQEYTPVQKPEFKTAKGGFHGFGKNSKSAFVPLSHEERKQKEKKLTEFRKVIGKEEGRHAEDLDMVSERAIDLALKRANMQANQMIEVTVEQQVPLGEDDLIGDGMPPRSQRPHTAKPKSLMDA